MLNLQDREIVKCALSRGLEKHYAEKTRVKYKRNGEGEYFFTTSKHWGDYWEAYRKYFEKIFRRLEDATGIEKGFQKSESRIGITTERIAKPVPIENIISGIVLIT